MLGELDEEAEPLATREQVNRPAGPLLSLLGGCPGVGTGERVRAGRVVDRPVRSARAVGQGIGHRESPGVVDMRGPGPGQFRLFLLGGNAEEITIGLIGHVEILRGGGHD